MKNTEHRVLEAGGKLLLTEVPNQWSEVADATGTGVFLRGVSTESACFLELPLGRIAALRRFTSGYRHRPFWMRPGTGTREAELRSETQWMLAELNDGGFLLLAPLLDHSTRFSLRGDAGGIVVVGETGDPQLLTSGGVALFVARGDDPYTLAAAAARAVRTHLQAGRLAVEKKIPDFIDWFGWCTWDAFYQEVSADKVRLGLESFAKGGVEPRLLILDDGWQSVGPATAGERRLTSFAPNERFGGDLAPLVRMAKEEFKVQRLLVWHALMGYWGGVDAAALPGYGSRVVARSFGPGILACDSHWNIRPWGGVVSVPGAEEIGRFYDDYHRQLATQGVDGVKVDNQAMLEAVASGQGGRVALHRAYRMALETSVNRHFSGRLINCMSCTTECALLAVDSVVMRSSDDFWPMRPETHGEHLCTNAQAGVWFGEFMRPDWDMFQSAHPYGAFHAAARAISGGPVYVSDKPGQHDFTLLKKLVLSDGTVLRGDAPGRPTVDVLFADPTVDPVLLKIFNTNRDCGVVGVFNTRFQKAEGAATLTTEVGPADVPTLRADRFVAYAHRGGWIRLCARETRFPVSLAEGEWEILSFAPVEHGFAALGLADKFNSTGAVRAHEWSDADECRLELRDGGEFLAWSERAPVAVTCEGAAIACDYETATGRLAVAVPVGGARTLRLRW